MRYIFSFYLFLLFSCTSSSNRLPADVIDKEIPTIAVLEFENKANFFFDWNIGGGIRDSLIDELVRSKRYKIVTRQDLNAVLSELKVQSNKLFRPEGKVKTGRLHNVKYLLKGSVTDFAHVAGGGIRSFFSSFGLGVNSDLAVVTVTLYIIDVETGAIVASKQVEGQAYSSKVDVSGQYKNVSFGSGGFYRTPLGKACKKLIGQAMDEIGDVISHSQWYPRVIKSENNKVIISGGEDRGLIAGSEFQAFYRGSALLDPQTGDLLGFEDGRKSGLLRVLEVRDKFSICEALKGDFPRGASLRPVR